MNRSFLGFLPLLLLGALPFASAACGIGGSESPLFGDDGGPNPKGDDAGADGGCGPEPAIGCEVPCGGGTTTPECVNGSWQCPSYAGYGECPIQVDAGDDDDYDGGTPCPSTPPSGSCFDTAHTYANQSCTYYDVLIPGPWCTAAACDVWCDWDDPTGGATWVRSCTACIEDGGEPDATPPFDASSPLFACGDTACDPETSYCEIFSGGAVPEDGGTSTTYTCFKLPSSCTPGAATCTCVEGFQGAGCGCVDSNGKVIETCDVP